MQDPAKYVIRASLSTSGVVERTDVVGAVFGQTEGLLGEELELRSLQKSDRVGRIDVDIESSGGAATGTMSIATNMDRIETAVLAAALETIDRIGPCRASITVEGIDDLRAVKRRQIVDRARELVETGFDDVGLAGRDLITAVRDTTTPVPIDEYVGYPAGPAIADADEVIVVEGRADVTRLLDYGIENVVGVSGTDVPPAIADLTEATTVTAFFDGDRGGDLLLLELAQMGDVDFVTFAPPGRAVEDLTREEVRTALEQKVPYEGNQSEATDEEPEAVADSVQAHVRTVFDGDQEYLLLDGDGARIPVDDSENVIDALASADAVGMTVVVDARITQELLDTASDGAVDVVIGRDLGDTTKRPADVRVLPIDAFQEPDRVSPVLD